MSAIMSDLSTVDGTGSSTGLSADPSADLSALAWVHDELQRSLDAAHKALRRVVREADAIGSSDIDTVDPAVLRTARAQIHQGVGALELIGESAAATVLRASESAVQRFVAKPHKLTAQAVDDVEQVSFALLDYLNRRLAGKPVSPLSLFPQYRAVQEAAGADRVHPADLWSAEWQWHDVPPDASAEPRQADAVTRSALEGQLLPLMRAANPKKAAARMSDLAAGLGAGAAHAHVATVWQLAAAVFEAQAQGLLGFDVFSKRVASRLLAQFRMLERGETGVSERLAQDLLFFCAQSVPPGAGEVAPRLTAARQAFGLVDRIPANYSVSALGRFDPAVIAQARKRVAAAKDAWSAVAASEMHRLAGLAEQFVLVGESLKRLFPRGEALAAELQLAIVQTQQRGASPAVPLAMEVATSLLYIEAALEDADFDHPQQAERVQRLADRLAGVLAGRAPEPLEGWMEELYRRVSDRQTMGSVVQELRLSLAEAEKLIDQYFRDPSDREVLIPVPSQLAAMRGVLSVLGMDHAAAALLRMRDEVDALASTEVELEHVGQTGVFDRLAGNLGALGFLIDMLSVQPQMAKSLFTYDADTGALAPVMGRLNAARAPAPNGSLPVEQRLMEQAQMLAFTSVRDDVPLADVARDLEHLLHEAQAADQPALAATVQKARDALERASDAAGENTARSELSEALVDFVASASEPVALAPDAGTERVSAPIALDFEPSAASAALAQDDEMREVFLEEAREVLESAMNARSELVRAPDDLGLQTLLRRAFHTLKGSSRMVGLKDFGDAAWACEQLYNTRLADQTPASEPLLRCTEWVLGYLAAWVDEISANGRVTHDSAAVMAAALQAEAPTLGLADAPASSAAAFAVGLPGALDADAPDVIDLDVPAPAGATSLPAAQASPWVPEGSGAGLDSRSFEDGADLPVLSFELDLATLDTDAEPADRYQVISERMPLDGPVFPAGAAAFPATPEAEPLPLGDSAELSASDAMDFQLDFGAEPWAPAEAADVADAAGTTDRAHRTDAEAAAATDADASAPDSRADPSPSEPLTFGAALAAGDGVLGEATPERFEVEDDAVKVVGRLRIGIPLFNIYLNEADELSRQLTTEVAEWAMELHRPIGDAPIALAHSLAGSSATVGFTDLSQLARSLEHAQTRSQAIGRGTPEEALLFVDATEEIRRLLHQFAAGFLREPSPGLLARLEAHELSSARRLEAASAAADALALEYEAPASGWHPDDAAAHEPRTVFDPRGLDVLADEGRLAPDEAASQAPDAPVPEEAARGETASYQAAGDEPALHRAAPDEPICNPAPPDEPSRDEPVPVKAFDWDDDAVETVVAGLDERGPPRVPAADVPEAFAPGMPGISESLSPTGSTPPSDAAMAHVEPPPLTPAHPTVGEPPHPEPATQTVEGEPPLRLPVVPHAAARDTDFEPIGLAELRPLGDWPVASQRALPVSGDSLGDGSADDTLDAVDAIDDELFPIFAEEAEELLPQLASRLRDWLKKPTDAAPPAACMRTLHTLKGGARLAGAMRLGEMAHRLETNIERLLAEPAVSAADVETLQSHGDALTQTFEALRSGGVPDPASPGVREAPVSRPYGSAPAAPVADLAVLLANAPLASAMLDATPEAARLAQAAPSADTSPVTTPPATPAPLEVPEVARRESSDAARTDAEAEGESGGEDETEDESALDPSDGAESAQPEIDWSRFAMGDAAVAPKPADRLQGAQSAVRVRAPVLDRLVNQAGEVSITRLRIETGVGQIKTSLADLTENLERLRAQLRDIEFHGEIQMTSRLEAAKAASQSFDPLEFDRFTRFQELTRMMAESVNDVATVQRGLQRSIETTEDELVAQARMTRDLQDDLLRTRMVEFEGLSDRLYRVVRQAAKETGKSVRLDLIGGSLEVDRGVLDRMTGAFEHLLRNCVSHGIEAPEVRAAAGKDATGSITVALTQEANEVGVEFRDDGAGLNLERIRDKGLALGLIEPDAAPSDAELANLIFAPGFSTADQITELSGRGVGMDVVRADVNAMGGRIETATAAGQGTAFKLILPLTTAVTQVVMLRCGTTQVAVPSTLVEIVRRATPAETDEAYATGSYHHGERTLQFFWLGALLQISARPADSSARTRSIVVIRSAQQRIALHVDEVVGNQEVVVKNLGPQLSRLPGLAGITLLASGAVALIYNPVALAALYGDAARAATQAALGGRANGADGAEGVDAQVATTHTGEPAFADPRFADGSGSGSLEDAKAPEAPLVLVVDDSLTVRRVTQRLLVREGYRVVLAKDGLDALERLGEAIPHIVLSDIEMPRMDGFDLVRNMRNDARLRALPVIMITSRIAQKHRDYAAELGVDHYLGKPYSEDDLLALIARYTKDRIAA